MHSNKQYDLIFSLGGNCSAAHNLKYRNKRPFSLPFDWLYIINDQPIWKLADCFDEDFNKFCLKENLLPLPDGENDSHKDKVHYYDSYTGYRFVNHFTKKIEDGGFESVNKNNIKRIKRLYDYINKSQCILLILSTAFEMDTSCILNLKKCLENKWPKKQFDFEIISFGCKEDSIISDNNITVRKYKRDINPYDFNQTNFEWIFLDNIQLNPMIISRYPKKLFSVTIGNFKLRLNLERENKI